MEWCLEVGKHASVPMGTSVISGEGSSEPLCVDGPAVLGWALELWGVRGILDQADAMWEGRHLSARKWHWAANSYKQGWKNDIETKMGKSVPGEVTMLGWSGPWDRGQWEDSKKRDLEEPQTEAKYRPWCLLGTNAYFCREGAVESTREKIKHRVEQVVLSDQNMAQGTDWEHVAELCSSELPWGVERYQ